MECFEGRLVFALVTVRMFDSAWNTLDRINGRDKLRQPNKSVKKTKNVDPENGCNVHKSFWITTLKALWCL